MNRATGTYRVTKWEDEEVKAFLPAPLPPANPPLKIDDEIARLLSNAQTAIGKLSVAADMVPSADWFLYGFVRKEALITSQIEGTQATLRDVLTFEAEEQPQRPKMFAKSATILKLSLMPEKNCPARRDFLYRFAYYARHTND